MWNEILKNYKNLTNPIYQIKKEIPTLFISEDIEDVKDFLTGCGVKSNYNVQIEDEHLIPFYGVFDEEGYGHESCHYILVDIFSGKFYEINDSHCSCNGFENMELENMELEYLIKGYKMRELQNLFKNLFEFLASKSDIIEEYKKSIKYEN